MRIQTVLVMLGLPVVAHASELDEVKGWRATRSVAVDAAPAIVAPHVTDIADWPAWTSWGKGDCSGTPGAVGRTCTWTGVDEKLKVVITAADAGSIHYDYFYDDAKVANKGILSWSPSETGTKLTWDEAGTKKSVPKDMKKTAADDTAKDIDVGLAKLTALAEADRKHLADVAAANKKAADLDVVAKAAEADLAAATSVWLDAKVAADTATAAVTAAKKPKDKAALQLSADAATRAAATAKETVDAATAAAATARKQADDARADAAKLSPVASSPDGGQAEPAEKPEP
jgi:hypothetical protein